MNKSFVRPNFILEKEDIGKNYGRFVVEPLERGFGVTLGNALRRTIISSTPGAGIYCLKIKGTSHEFSSLRGVKENIIEIILNIKKIILKIDDNLFTEEERQKIILKLNVQEKGEVFAGDIICPAGVEIINKDLYLATIAENGSLEINFYCRNSRGFDRADENKKLLSSLNELGLGYISIDTKYTPIEKVSFLVETTKVGKSADLEKLTIDITTNGSISPNDAIAIGAKILEEHLQYFSNLNETISQMKVMSSVVKKEEDILNKSIEELGLKPRSYNALQRVKVKVLGDIVAMTKDQIMKINSIGRTSYKEIEQKLLSFGLTFATEE